MTKLKLNNNLEQLEQTKENDKLNKIEIEIPEKQILLDGFTSGAVAMDVTKYLNTKHELVILEEYIRRRKANIITIFK